MKTVSQEQLVEEIVDILDEKKAEDIVVLNIQKKSSIADYFVICTGLANRHVVSLADEVEEKLKKDFSTAVLRSDGWNDQEWVVLDYGSILVHIFTPEQRKLVKLEELWAKL